VGGQSYVTSLTLTRLGERDAAAIVARLVGNKELPADVITEIVGRSDGIPLFVEEMTKAVLEAGARVRRGAQLRLFRPRRWRSLQACTPR